MKLCAVAKYTVTFNRFFLCKFTEYMQEMFALSLNMQNANVHIHQIHEMKLYIFAEW
jgi:hypothetical protein